MRTIPLVATISLLAMAAGPAIAQNAGTRMADQAERSGDRADSQGDLAKQWKDGEKMMAAGNKLIRKSEARMAGFARDASKLQARADRATADGRKAEASLAEGRRMVEAGARLKAQAEASFPRVPAA